MNKKLCYQTVFFALLLLYSNILMALTVQSKSESFVDKNAFYSYKMQYPQFLDSLPNIVSLNQQAIKQAQDLVVKFKAQIESPTALKSMHQHVPLPLNEKSNYAEVAYKVFLQRPQIVSIRYDSFFYYYAEAHPNKVYASLNYDMDQKKSLTLADIFSSMQILKVFSQKSRDILQKKLDMEISKVPANSLSVIEKFAEKNLQKGTEPVLENFQCWNLTEQGILLTFPAGQAMSYVDGPQEILIPYTEIKSLMKPEAINLLFADKNR